MHIGRRCEANREATAKLPAAVRRRVEWYRRRATRRKLVLLDCAIARHAPFEECGATLAEWMARRSFYRCRMPPAEWLRHWNATREEPLLPVEDASWRYFTMDGELALRWLEEGADQPDEDKIFLVREYFHLCEWCAEASCFDPPEDLREWAQVGYGVANWLYGIGDDGDWRWNVLDFYLGEYPGEYECWATRRPLHPAHRGVAIALIEDLMGFPDDNPRFDPVWRTEAVVSLATSMDDARDFSAMLRLADALEAAGCDNRHMLDHCRSGRVHAKGCWVVDRILGRG